MKATSDGGVEVELRTDNGVVDVSMLSRGRQKIQILTMTNPPLPLGNPFFVNIPEDTCNGGYKHEVGSSDFRWKTNSGKYYISFKN